METPHLALPAELLVGSATGDDAAVWTIDEGRALVATADFITPVVDDPFIWGQVAATNAVSDVYAMGGRPLFALNLAGWSRDALPLDLLGEVLAGGADVAQRAGFFIVGGHTIDDPEPKYGLSVIGEVDPAKMLTNAGLQPHQDLILTKPLGIGVITTAIKADMVNPQVVQGAVASMTKLNAQAAAIAVESGATGCTDVTGFGLLGHLGRMAKESGVSATIELETVPLLDGARHLAAEGIMPGGSRRNLESLSDLLEPGSVDHLDQLLLADAQTSGGLVFGVDPQHTTSVLDQLHRSDHIAARIGFTGSMAPRLALK